MISKPVCWMYKVRELTTDINSGYGKKNKNHKTTNANGRSMLVTNKHKNKSNNTERYVLSMEEVRLKMNALMDELISMIFRQQ